MVIILLMYVDGPLFINCLLKTIAVVKFEGRGGGGGGRGGGLKGGGEYFGNRLGG